MSDESKVSSHTTLKISLPVSISHLLIEWSHEAEYTLPCSGQTTEDTHCV